MHGAVAEAEDLARVAAVADGVAQARGAEDAGHHRDVRDVDLGGAAGRQGDLAAQRHDRRVAVDDPLLAHDEVAVDDLGADALVVVAREERGRRCRAQVGLLGAAWALHHDMARVEVGAQRDVVEVAVGQRAQGRAAAPAREADAARGQAAARVQRHARTRALQEDVAVVGQARRAGDAPGRFQVRQRGARCHLGPAVGRQVGAQVARPQEEKVAPGGVAGVARREQVARAGVAGRVQLEVAAAGRRPAVQVVFLLLLHRHGLADRLQAQRLAAQRRGGLVQRRRQRREGDAGLGGQP